MAANAEISKADISKELWREYRFGGSVHRIESPQWLFTRQGGTTHRVQDSNGIVHCVPAPGEKGCVLLWQPANVSDPVQF